MLLNGTLNQKEKGLISVGVSIAAGCQPCSAHHFKAAHTAGATITEIRQAVDDALCVRNSATKTMAELAAKHLGYEPNADGLGCSEKPLIGELVSVGAALAVNCSTSLESHLATALRLGATDRQIQTTLGIARAIKKVAAQKAKVVVTAVTEPVGAIESQIGEVDGEDCGCSSTDDSQTQGATGACSADEPVAATENVETRPVTEQCGCS